MLPPLQMLVLHILTEQFRFAPAAGGENPIVPLVPPSPLQSGPSDIFSRTKILCKWAQLHQSDAFSCSQPMWDIHSSHTTLWLCVPSSPPLKLSSSSTWMMLPSCQPGRMALPSLAMRRGQVLLNRFIPCLSYKHLGYKRATTQTCSFPASQLPAVLVRRWVESMNDIWPFYCQLNFQLSVHPAAAWTAAPSLALRCPSRWCSPGLTCGTWVWACMTLIFPCLLCYSFSFMLLLPKK